MLHRDVPCHGFMPDGDVRHRRLTRWRGWFVGGFAGLGGTGLGGSADDR
jgi:hypothetical protein